MIFSYLGAAHAVSHLIYLFFYSFFLIYYYHSSYCYYYYCHYSYNNHFLLLFPGAALAVSHAAFDSEHRLTSNLIIKRKTGKINIEIALFQSIKTLSLTIYNFFKFLILQCKIKCKINNFFDIFKNNNSQNNNNNGILVDYDLVRNSSSHGFLTNEEMVEMEKNDSENTENNENNTENNSKNDSKNVEMNSIYNSKINVNSNNKLDNNFEINSEINSENDDAEISKSEQNLLDMINKNSKNKNILDGDDNEIVTEIFNSNINTNNNKNSINNKGIKNYKVSYEILQNIPQGHTDLEKVLSSDLFFQINSLNVQSGESLLFHPSGLNLTLKRCV